MTKNEIKKAIAELNDRIAFTGHYEIEKCEQVRMDGHGMFVGTGVYVSKEIWKPDFEKIAEIKAEINRLANLYRELYGAKEEEQARKAKIKRYEKELKELEERKAYLEKWLAENK